MKSIEIGQRDAIVGHQTKSKLVIVFSLAPLPFDVQQGTQVSVHSHVLLKCSQKFRDEGTHVEKGFNLREVSAERLVGKTIRLCLIL